MDFKVVEARRREDFTIKVKDYLREGWMPKYESFSMATSWGSWYAIIMVKE